ncbi:MAG: NfeD family protein [Bacteroidales bacterium]|jgi:membrane protein implicated in regulation of membrane protease activity|nr:NfeD family protein [Bacteroidales bacterium]MBR6864161.1 NfeD family protein [Bacteroidales bacterium]
MIASWWADLSPVMKLLWGVTLTASLIFVIQTVMTFLGADADSTDFDVDVDTSMDGSDLSNIDGGANLYTFRNFVNFFLGFGWTAIILQPSVKSTALLVIISVLVGLALVALVMYMFKWLNSMQQSGNINVYKSAVGCQGKCYLRIPGERGGEGKVQITIQGAVREYNAVTDGDTIKTGASVKVIEAIDGNTLLVEELNSYII